MKKRIAYVALLLCVTVGVCIAVNARAQEETMHRQAVLDVLHTVTAENLTDMRILYNPQGTRVLTDDPVLPQILALFSQVEVEAIQAPPAIRPGATANASLYVVLRDREFYLDPYDNGAFCYEGKAEHGFGYFVDIPGLAELLW